MRGSTRTGTDVVIVGAGHNGLVTAFYLARAGFRVRLLEARSHVGGAVATEELIDGFRFSTCAFRLWGLQRPVIRDMGLAGRVTVRQPEPTVLRLYPDGRALKQWSDLRRAAAILGELVTGHHVTANLVPDAMLAALATEHGLTVMSADTDFARFGEVRWENSPTDS